MTPMTRKLLLLLTLLLPVAVLSAPAAALPAPWTPLGPFGGTVPRLTADPAHPGTVYAVAGHAIFKTVDGGVSWKTVYVGTVESNLAIDPVHPATLYAGAIGPIVIKSTDGGATWKPSANGLPPDPVLVPRLLAVDPRDPRRLLLSYGQGLWRSADAGASWQPADAGLPGGANQLIEDIAISAGAAFVATPGGVYRSVDGGRSWAPVGDGLPASPTSALAVAPSDRRTVYASVSGEGLYLSRDDGASWRRVAGPENAYTQALTVSPRSFRTLYAIIAGHPVRSQDGGAHWTDLDGVPRALDLAVDSRGTVYAGGAGPPGGVFRSDDSGATWTRRIQGLTALPTTDMAVDPEDPSRIWAAYANALYRTANGGRRWVRVPGPSGLLLTGPLAIGAGSQVYAEGRDNNGKGIWTADRDGASWRQLLGSPEITRIDTFRLASDLSTLYVAGSDLFNQEAVYRSTDGGATWQLRSSGAPLPAPGPGCRIEDLAVAASNAAVLYLAGSTYDPAIPGCRSTVIRSDDGGATWTSLAGGPPVGVVSHLAVDPRDPRVVYAGTGDGLTPGDGLWKSTDGGVTWSKIDNFRVQTITALLAATVPGRIYAATFGQVFRSDDGGATWQTRNRALRTEEVFELVADPVDPQRIYAATLNGVWTLREAD
jgi:photosystem II stability/assembly factor-like uncharacterized protein